MGLNEVVTACVYCVLIRLVGGQCTMDERNPRHPKPRDCTELQRQGFTISGIYTVYYLEGNTQQAVRVYCDMDTSGGGWLMFQRRVDGEKDFYRGWNNYTEGFGTLDTEFWLGNYHLHAITSGGSYRLRVDLEDFEGVRRYAEYDEFRVGPVRDKFRLHLVGYRENSTAGNGFNTTVAEVDHKRISNHEAMFSTKDQDNDITETTNCAEMFKGAWWYDTCHVANLNGLYHEGSHNTYADGINWYPWHGFYYSLKTTEMKFRPA